MEDFQENKILNELEAREGRLILRSKPRFLENISLTNECNLKCIMCGQRRQTQTRLTYEEAKCIEELFPFLEIIRWQGGEVFLLDYFKKLFTASLAYPHIAHQTQTNGLLLNEEWADLLTRGNVQLQFSIDGVREKTYESIRIGGRYSQLTNNLSLLNRYRKKNGSKAQSVLCAVIMELNYREIMDFFEFAQRYQFTTVAFSYDHGNCLPEQNIFLNQDQKALDFLRETLPILRKKCAENGIYLHCHFQSFLDQKSRREEDWERKKPVSRTAWRCKYPWMGLNVFAMEKAVTPNCLCKTPIGYIGEMPLLEMWNNKIMQTYRSEMRDSRYDGKCSGCIPVNMPEDSFLPE